MFYRKDAVLMAVAGLLASSGFAMADSTGLQTPVQSPDPTVVRADDAATQAPLMMALDKVGAAKPLSDAGLNIYGWVEAGYTWNHRNNGTPIIPGPFNLEIGNHFMLNQIDIRFEKVIADPKKFDVGGLVEVMYGTDANRIHSTGWGFNGSDATDNNDPPDRAAVANIDPQYQFDATQAYVDVSVPIGNGLIIRTGKWVTLYSYETIDPRGNLFYSHSFLFSAVPFTQTGILGMYKINDQWAVKAGISRGWDITMEDDNGCAIDTIGMVTYTPNKNLTINLTGGTGPENYHDTSHYRTVLDPTVTWKATDQITLGGEVLYWFDGGANGDGPPFTHAYGDVWGAAVYGSYKVNDYVTVNGRAEKVHALLDFSGFQAAGGFSTMDGGPIGISAYEVTLGLGITPMPKDPIGKNLTIRPEVRYDFTDSTAHKFFPTNGGDNVYKDQLTFGADVIFTF